MIRIPVKRGKEGFKEVTTFDLRAPLNETGRNWGHKCR